MNLRKALIIAGLVVALLMAVLIRHQRLRAAANEREDYFLSIHAVTSQRIAEIEPDNKRPKNLEELFSASSFRDMPILLRPFPLGLDFKWEGDGWTLAEPAPRKVSLFRQDRLVSSDKDFPHWEQSGKRAVK